MVYPKKSLYLELSTGINNESLDRKNTWDELKIQIKNLRNYING